MIIRLPRLLGADLHERERLNPVSLRIDLTLAPLSTAEMILAPDAPIVVVGDLIELYTIHGSVGIFRVQQMERTYTGETRLSLEHGLVTMSDSIIPGKLDGENVTAAGPALWEIMSYQTTWQLGTVETGEEPQLTWSYDYSNVLESITDIVDQLPEYMLTYDQRSLPWTLNVVRMDDTPSCECRLSRNLASLSVQTDRSELCTRLYIPGLDAPLEADTIAQWGVVARSMTGDEGLTEDDLRQRGQQYLEKHKNPSITVTLDAFDLHEATGEDLDYFRLGRMCRVCLPDYSMTINQRVTQISYPDVYSEPEHVEITLADTAQTAADTLAGLIVSTTEVRRVQVTRGPMGSWQRAKLATGSITMEKDVTTMSLMGADGNPVTVRVMHDFDIDLPTVTLEYIGKQPEGGTA